MGFSGGDEQPSSQTRTAGALGILDGADLRIVFDANESGGNGITLAALRLLVLNPTTGALIFSADLAAPVVLAATLQGNGKSDALLALDAAQATAFDSAIVLSGVALADVRIGLNANLSDSSGGFESFYVGNRSNLGGVPEPSTYMLTAAGLLGLGLLRSRRS